MKLAPFLLLAAAAVAHAEPVEVKQTIKTLAAQMKYDTEKFSVPPGAKVIVTFENHDEMPHNVVFCLQTADGKDDGGMEVAQAGWALGEKGIPQSWIPQHPRILGHSKLVDPHKTETVTFTAPEKPGNYPFVCTVPGHAAIMKGAMIVQQATKPIVGLHYRYFEGEFPEFPDFAKLTPLSSGPLPDGRLDVKADPATAKRKKGYALEFEGVLTAPVDGDYELTLASDDGVQILLNGKPVLDNRKSKVANKLAIKKLPLKQGEHPILVRYYQNIGGAALSLTWSGPGFDAAPLSRDNLTAKLLEEEKNRYVGLPLKPASEPIIYRNFVEGGSARGIAVGFPGGVNVNWDANAMSVVQVWQGAFIDAKRHWTDRGVGFQPPAGFGLVKPVQAPVRPLFAESEDKAAELQAAPGVGQPFAVLASADEPWPQEDSRAAGYRYRGYDLNAKREPIFRYETPDGTVTDTFSPAVSTGGPALVRTITYTPKPGAKSAPVYFRAAAAKDAKLDGNSVALGDVKLAIAGGKPAVRTAGELSEVLVPVQGPATLTLTYAWSAAHQH